MQPRISSVDLVERISRNGIPDAITARLVAHATLRVLGERLTDDEARALTEALAPDLADVVDRSEYERGFESAEFYERVRERTKMPAGAAHEGVDVVLRAIGDMLDDDVRTRIASALPVPLGERMIGSTFGEPAPYPAPRVTPRHATLATGRPGSRHPLSEAAPPGPHVHSVARNAEPHQETKLSSTRGLTQERLGDSLAEGRPPGSARPIADAKDD